MDSTCKIVNDTLIFNICTKAFKKVDKFQGDQKKMERPIPDKKEINFEWLISC
jgi:hypothetical protein